jgi:hypothetical protein
LPEFVAGYNLTRVVEKKGENLKRLFLQLDSNAMLAQLRRPQVHLKNTKSPGTRGTLRRLHGHTPQ